MWSLGCIMAELLTKKVLFDAQSEIEQVKKIFDLLGTPTEENWPGHKQLKNMDKVRACFHCHNCKRPRRHVRCLCRGWLWWRAGQSIGNGVLKHVTPCHWFCFACHMGRHTCHLTLAFCWTQAAALARDLSSRTWLSFCAMSPDAIS